MTLASASTVRAQKGVREREGDIAATFGIAAIAVIFLIAAMWSAKSLMKAAAVRRPEKTKERKHDNKKTHEDIPFQAESTPKVPLSKIVECLNGRHELRTGYNSYACYVTCRECKHHFTWKQIPREVDFEKASAPEKKILLQMAKPFFVI